MKKFNRTNKIFMLPKEDLENLIKESTSLKDVLLKLGYTPNGTQYKNLKQKCLEENIEISQLVRKEGTNTHKPIEFYLKNNFYVSSVFLKKKLIKLGLLEEKCSGKGCSIEKTWIGYPISLQLDHINGNNSDNRIENLRILCPNCHCQTDTHSGKNRKRSIATDLLNFNKDFMNSENNSKDNFPKCSLCSNSIHKNNKNGVCNTCRISSFKKNREALVLSIKELIAKEPLTTIAKKLNMSAANLTKILRKERIEYPKNDHWERVNSESTSTNLTGKVRIQSRKYNYDFIYQKYLDNNESYAKTAKALNMNKEVVRTIIVSHKLFLSKN